MIIVETPSQQPPKEPVPLTQDSLKWFEMAEAFHRVRAAWLASDARKRALEELLREAEGEEYRLADVLRHLKASLLAVWRLDTSNLQIKAALDTDASKEADF